MEGAFADQSNKPYIDIYSCSE